MIEWISPSSRRVRMGSQAFQGVVREDGLIEIIPNGSSKKIDFEGDQFLREIPNGLIFPGSLEIRGCPNFSKAPTELVAIGAVSIIGCPSLRTPPRVIRAGGKRGFGIDIASCDNLASLPQELSTDSDYIGLPYQFGLKDLPDRISCRVAVIFDGEYAATHGINEVQAHISSRRLRSDVGAMNNNDDKAVDVDDPSAVKAARRSL